MIVTCPTCSESEHLTCGPEQCKLMCCDQEMQLKS